MLAQARKRLQAAGLTSVELVRGDALRLPFDDDSFDLLVNGYMLDLLTREDIPRALASSNGSCAPRDGWSCRT